MTFSINFLDYMIIDGRDVWSYVNLDRAARRLKVKPTELVDLFDLWAKKGYPQELFVPTEIHEKKKIGLRLWNYQPNAFEVNLMGVVMKVRTWGDGYRDIDGEHLRESFHLGVIA